jgi:hypothetical protein
MNKKSLAKLILARLYICIDVYDYQESIGIL